MATNIKVANTSVIETAILLTNNKVSFTLTVNYVTSKAKFTSVKSADLMKKLIKDAQITTDIHRRIYTYFEIDL